MPGDQLVYHKTKVIKINSNINTNAEGYIYFNKNLGTSVSFGENQKGIIKSKLGDTGSVRITRLFKTLHFENWMFPSSGARGNAYSVGSLRKSGR
jgi:hypothetical protein